MVLHLRLDLHPIRINCETGGCPLTSVGAQVMLTSGMQARTDGARRAFRQPKTVGLGQAGYPFAGHA